MEQRYEYKFVRVPIHGGWWSGKIEPDYQDAIVTHARDGWRLVTAFAPAAMGYGRATVVELIFERPLER
jgi:hypothetical protein